MLATPPFGSRRPRRGAIAALVQPAAAQEGRIHEGFSRDPNQVVKTTALDYADLNLASPQGVQVLRSRIENAAKAVCGPPETEAALKAEYDACRRNAFNVASDAVHLPQLFAAAAQHGGAVQLAAN